MSGRWLRLRDWWSTAPAINDDDLVEPEPDDRLAAEMRALAEAVASTAPRLDFSVESVEAVSRQVRGCTPAELKTLAAYVGEVLVRHTDAYWGRGGRYGENPGVIAVKWVADPEQWMRSMQADGRYGDDYLVEAVADTLQVTADPASAVAGAVVTPGQTTQWEALRHQLAQWRRSWQRRRGRA